MKKIIPFAIIALIPFIFFWQFFIKGLLPIPADTIIGLYYPFRDAYFKTNPNGLPYKNFLVTDPVRQLYPWRQITIEAEKKGNLPTWNPYNFTGTPLLANFQSAAFYPFNILFFILPFQISWSLLILLEPLLAGIFLYLYLNNLKLRKEASLLGAIVFSFSGFSIAWMEWGTILHTSLWLPLILLSIDKIFYHFSSFDNSKLPGLDKRPLRLSEARSGAGKTQNSKLQFKSKNYLIWCAVFLFSLVSSFFAGHLQIFVYLFIFSIAYFLARYVQFGRRLETLLLFVICYLLFVIATAIQWLPTLQFIYLSGRNLDQIPWQNPGWFIPWQNLIQFIAPDFFGNPATLNYYGIWNYGEFIGYVGMSPIIIAFLALFFRKDKKTIFFGIAFFVSLILAFPTIFAKLPFKFDLPLISTSQPTRLLFVTDFSLSILAALGLDYFIFLKNKKQVLYILGLFSVFFVLLWGFIIIFHGNLISLENLKVARQNLIFPTILFLITSLLILVFIFFPEKNKYKQKTVPSLIYGLIILTVIDLFRFGWKFEPFTKKEYLFPSTSVTTFLQNQKQPFRIMSTDSRILPPNFSIMYKIQTLDGYDPLYLQRYGELMAASGRGVPDIKPPFGFNRIITPQDYLSRINDLLGVKYVLSLQDLKNKKLNLVFTDGFVKVYENSTVLPRAFFVNKTLIAKSKQQAINALFEVNYQLNFRAVIEDISSENLFKSNWDIGQVNFINYSEKKVILKTNNPGEGFLVFTDSYYPTWHAKIDEVETKIYLTDFNFRGIIVPKGNHIIEFYDKLF